MSTAHEWFKSSYSGSDGGNCLEVAYTRPESATRPATVHLRDSKNPDGPTFTTTPAAWTAFTAYAAES
ncbi:DUF397 domain-containing protein [Streptomyces sp. NPDC051784]|uniref:DUF397 domain-containing protein n=1 Tax=Streptomyces sp. NPDC051784 TaxID=3155805 RepID=UPI0034365CD5